MTQSHEIFILRVSAFLKMTRLYPKTSEDARIFGSRSKEVCSSQENDYVLEILGNYCHLLILHWTFLFSLWFELTYF